MSKQLIKEEIDRSNWPKIGGLYRHFKGSTYRVQTIVFDTNTKALSVAYRSTGDFLLPDPSRPLEEWFEEIDRPAYKGPRFVEVKDSPSVSQEDYPPLTLSQRLSVFVMEALGWERYSCGLRRDGVSSALLSSQPAENLDEAFACLEEFCELHTGDYGVTRTASGNCYDCNLLFVKKMGYPRAMETGTGKTLQEAVCKAIVKAAAALL